MKHVVFLSIDNLRFDCVGFQDDKKELERHGVLHHLETPTLDRIAERGLCFTHCISTNTYTTSAHASLFTGLYPPHHGVRAFYGTPLSRGVVTIAGALRNSGYRTILYTDIPDLFVPLGLDRGFDLTSSGKDHDLFGLLAELKDDKVFLFAHFFDVHEPFLHNTNTYRPGVNDDYGQELIRLCNTYDRPGSYDGSKDGVGLWNALMRGPLRQRPADVLLPLYVRGVTKFDKGRFASFIDALEQLEMLGDSLTVILSDHGEGRCSHADKNFFSHAGNLYDNVLRVPLMLIHPDIARGIDGRLVSLVDVLPTVLALLDVAAPRHCDGLDILAGAREMAYAEVWASSRGLYVTDGRGRLETVDDGQWPESMMCQRAVRTATTKYVVTDRGRTEEFLGKECEALSDEDYVRNLYRRVLGRFEDPDGFRYHLNMLLQGAVARKDLLRTFVKSDEFASFPIHAVYDLQDDPEEDYPLPANPVSPTMYGYFSYIEELERGAVPPGTIFGPGAGTPEKKHVAALSVESIDEKEAKSQSIIRQAVAQFGIEHLGVAWTGGKDSTTVLHLIKAVFGGRVPLKVVNIDTTVKFPEIYEFRERMRAEWDLDLRIFRNEHASEWLQKAADHAECCYQLKTVPLNQAIEVLGLKALITGVRWDEQEARAREEYFSPRESPAHFRVQPILHFRESDIWDYIRKHDVPYCELYDRGYRSLGCAPCTSPSDGTGPERGGRARDKEEIMERLRELGYF